MRDPKKEPVDTLTPFLGKAKELPERSQEVLRHAFSSAEVVEDAGKNPSAPCPVCGALVEGVYVAVKVVGRKAELLPKQVVHMVLAHDFWHPSLELFLRQPPALALGGGSSIDEEETLQNLDGDLDGLLSEEELGAESEEVVQRKPRTLERRPSGGGGEPPDELPFSGSGEELFDEVDVDVGRIGRSPSVGPRAAGGGRRAGGGEARSPMSGRRPEVGEQRARDGRGGPPSPLARVEPDADADQICRAYRISPELSRAIAAIARSVGAEPVDLANLLYFESRFDPKAGGPSDPRAVGLAQFSPKTAASIGTSVDALRRMTALEQAPFVKRHLDAVRRGRPLDTPHKLYMAVFYPPAVDWDPDKPFPEDLVRRNTYEAEGSVVSIRCPADYARRVEFRAKMPSSSPAPAAPQASPLDGVLAWFANLFSGLQGGDGSNGSRQDSGASATWSVAPGIAAVLVGEDGREWRPGRVPAGSYELVVNGQPPSRAELRAGQSYRASNLGRMFDVVEQ